MPWQPFMPSWCVSGDLGPHVPGLAERLVLCHQRGSLCPQLPDVWRAFELTGPEEVKVVLMGQDPYHGEGQAHGLSFSVLQEGGKRPPSLRNMFKELQGDVGTPLRTNNNLEDWARQGVLLLNAVLTTELGTAGAHQGLGWEAAVESTLEGWLRSRREPVVWLLWGRHAQALHARLSKVANRPNDVTLRSPHPSPLSASRGFFGSRPFSAVNEALASQGKAVINWG